MEEFQSLNPNLNIDNHASAPIKAEERDSETVGSDQQGVTFDPINGLGEPGGGNTVEPINGAGPQEVKPSNAPSGGGNKPPPQQKTDAIDDLF